MMVGMVDSGRRRFLQGRYSNDKSPLRPPWTAMDRMVAACSRCGDCIATCPQEVLRRGDGGFPEFDPKVGAGVCTFCGDCTQVCAADVFDITRSPPWMVTAGISDSACIAFDGIHCECCRDVCDERAIRFRPKLGGPPSPALDRDRCTGCGACVRACPSSAIALSDDATIEDWPGGTA